MGDKVTGMGAKGMIMKCKSLIISLLVISSLMYLMIYNIRVNKVAFYKSPAVSNAEKIRTTRKLEKEGKALLNQGKYAAAEEKLIAADDPKYWLHEGRPNGVARAWLRAALVMQGKYEAALENVQNNLSIIPDHQPSLEEELVYKALIKYRNEGNPASIYDVINILKSKYADRLPPKNYQGIGSLSVISTILRLYDMIGDYDAGIAYIDEILAYFRTGKAGDPKPGKVDAEYIKVREAFEQDKAEGFKGCAGAKPGEVCMGKATKALIQSDYFPW